MLLRRMVVPNSGTEACARVFCLNLWRGGDHVEKNFSTSSQRQRTRGPIKLTSTTSNLQKLKHLKYSDEFISKEIDRHNLSIRRLANMMGEDPDTYTEDDVKRAMRYLFPSDLDEDSLPSMDHPLKIYTSRLKVHWDENKRPLHYLYYTNRLNAHQLLHETYQYVLDARKMNSINEPEKQIDLGMTRWMTQRELENEILDGEVLNELVYNQIIAQLERLLEQDHAYIAEEFIKKHRKDIPVVAMMDSTKEPIEMEDGRKYVIEDGQKKTAIAQVKLVFPGTGKVTVNDKEFHKHFRFIEDRQTVLTPFTFLHLLGKFDIEASVDGGVTHPASFGNRVTYTDPTVRLSTQAVAIRLAISRALRVFVTSEQVEMMRRAGLLTFDKRWKERKVFGQHRARKKHTWKRR